MKIFTFITEKMDSFQTDVLCTYDLYLFYNCKLHSVGRALRLNTGLRDRVQNGKIPRYKDELIVTAKINTGFAEASLSQKAMQADDGEEAPPPSSPTAPSGSERCAACPVLIPEYWPLRF